MSSAPTDCRVPDPTDAKADGNFGNHRAGYGDRLDRIIATARKGWTLAAGEGLVLVQEIDRLRARCRQIDDEAYDYAEQIEQLNAAAKDSADHYADARAEIDRLREERDALQADILARSGFRTLWEIDHACVNNERDVALRILAALREPSEKVLLAAVEAVPYGASYAALTRCIPAAVAAAEREASA